MKYHNKKLRGSILLYVMIFGSFAFTLIVLGISGYALFEHRASTRVYRRDSALHIAEAGINYYRWHLAHNQTDYTDGTVDDPGPYLHEYSDKDGNLVGYYSLEIDEPLSGSTVVTVRSTGWTVSQPSSTRTIQIRLGFPSLTEYTFLENVDMSFSPTTEVHGQIHANGGIKFDGTTDSWVKSAKETYMYGSQWKDGIWGAGGPTSFWDFPVPAIDFDSVSADLASIRDRADDAETHFYDSGDEGWHVVFGGDTFDLYQVTSRDCYKGNGYYWYWWWIGDTYCYDIGNQSYVDTYQIPQNGAIFFEDDVWIDGIVDGRVTIGVGEFPVQAPYHTVYISGNLLYNEVSTDDVTGIIAQGNIIVPYEVPDDMTIQAAALSQYGSISRPYYYGDIHNSLTFFGSQISYLAGGWKWGSPVISGFVYTYHMYDGNLKYYPPPGFPVGDTYELISWEEVET